MILLEILYIIKEPIMSLMIGLGSILQSSLLEWLKDLLELFHLVIQKIAPDQKIQEPVRLHLGLR